MGMLDRCWFAGLLGHAFLLQAIIIVLRIATTYEAVSIGLDVVMIGLIGGAFGILPAIIALHTGRYIDRFGERVVLAAGSLAALAASVGFWLAPASLTILLVFSALTGVAQLLGVAGHHSAAARSTAALQAARFGQLTMFVSLAHMAGPLVFGIMASGRTVPDTGPIFLFAATCSVVLLLVTVLVRIPGRLGIPEITGLWHTVGSILRTKGYAPATTISVVLFSATDLLVIYLPLFATEREFSAATVGYLLALRGGASVISRFFFGFLYRTLDRDKLLLLALVVSGGAIALIPFISSLLLIGCLVFAAGFGLGVGAPLTLVWISGIIPAATMGSAVSLRLAINRVSQAALPVAVGAVAAGTGATAVILAIGASLLLSAGVSTMIGRNKARPKS